MDRRTLTALRGSIRKWEKIAAGTGRDKGHDNCALCIEFCTLSGCKGCPVFDKTGKHYCYETPYENAALLLVDDKATTVRAKRAAQVMVNFLKRLVPKEHRK